MSSFRNTCLYHRNLFCYSTEIVSSNPSLSFNPVHMVIKIAKRNGDLIMSITTFIQAMNQEVSVTEIDSLRNEGRDMVSIAKVV